MVSSPVNRNTGVRALVIAGLVACSSGDQGAPDAGVEPTSVDGPCTPEGEKVHPPPATPQTHVPSLAGITFTSNPPSWGPHCDTWGAYAIYDARSPLPRCHYLHNLEHGAVVLLYNCPRGCPEIVSALEAVYRDVAGDPDCNRRRIILTPDPELDVPVAAVAWGVTWRSACAQVDDGARAALLKFVEEHLGSRGISPEPLVCADGSVRP